MMWSENDSRMVHGWNSVNGAISCSLCGGKLDYIGEKCSHEYKSDLNSVDHPNHYKGKFETIDVIEDWKLGFNLGNTVKYISRAGKKDPAKYLEDLEKAAWYLKREIDNLKNNK